MKRLTVPLRGKYVIEDDSKLHHSTDGYYGDAVDFIARLENLTDEMTSDIASLTERMEALRTQGRERSYQFRELMGQRAFYTQVLDLLKDKGLS